MVVDDVAMPVDEPALSFDVTAAAWLRPRLLRDGSVTSWVPSGYESYARLLHPAHRHDGQPVRWDQVAAETGRSMHPYIEWYQLVGSSDPLNFEGADWLGEAPPRGLLPRQAFETTLKVLEKHTTTPDACWMCLWEGYSWLWDSREHRSEVRDAPRVHLNRDCLLFAGTLKSALALEDWPVGDWTFAQSPNLFWPEDRSWVVSTDIEDTASLIAGSAALVADLVSTEGLEVWPVDPHASLEPHSDDL